MPLQVPERPVWDGTPRDLGECFRLRKFQGPNQKRVCCRLFTHLSGYELRLEVNGESLRTEVCDEPDAVSRTLESWKADLITRGWRRSD